MLVLFGSKLGFSRILHHFRARSVSVGVQAFAYNSAESERIWMKYRALYEYIVRSCP